MYDDGDDWRDLDYYELDDADCEHEHYEIDVCTGRAECDSCSKSWYVSGEEINRELDRQANYYEDMEREERRQWWRDLWDRLMAPFRALRWRRKSVAATDDDDIPF